MATMEGRAKRQGAINDKLRDLIGQTCDEGKLFGDKLGQIMDPHVKRLCRESDNQNMMDLRDKIKEQGYLHGHWYWALVLDVIGIRAKVSSTACKRSIDG
eukprot:gene20132-7194_t